MPTLLSAPEKDAVFMCRRWNLRLIKTPRYPVMGAAGQKVGEHKGEALAFTQGVLRVGDRVRLEDGREVDGSEIVQWLEGHRLFGDKEEGFWRVDPTAPPVSQQELDLLQDAALAFDVDKLEQIIREERDGWGREQIISSAERTLEKIHGMLALQAEKAAAEAEKKGKSA